MTMERGHRLEAAIAARYAREVGAVVREVGSFPHPERPWLFFYVSVELSRNIPEKQLVKLEYRHTCYLHCVSCR
jgi:hypothetical protein